MLGCCGTVYCQWLKFVYFRPQIEGMSLYIETNFEMIILKV